MIRLIGRTRKSVLISRRISRNELNDAANSQVKTDIQKEMRELNIYVHSFELCSTGIILDEKINEISGNARHASRALACALPNFPPRKARSSETRLKYIRSDEIDVVNFSANAPTHIGNFRVKVRREKLFRVNTRDKSCKMRKI